MLFHGFGLLAPGSISPLPRVVRKITRLFCFYPSFPLLGLIFTLEKIRIKRRKKKADSVFFFGLYSAIVTSNCDRLVDIWRAQCRRSGTDRYKRTGVGILRMLGNRERPVSPFFSLLVIEFVRFVFFSLGIRRGGGLFCFPAKDPISETRSTD